MTTTIFNGDIKPPSLVLIAGRAFSSSTEMYITADTDLPEFWLALGPQGCARPLGYLRWVRCGEETVIGVRQGLFELTEVRPAGSPSPHPVVSLSGVLWTRPAAREADQVIQSFLLAGDPTLECGQLLDRGSFHHEA